jgi:hypothetical protein
LLDWIAPLVDLPRAFPSYFRASGGDGVPRALALQVHLVTPAAVWTVVLIAVWILYRLLVGRSSETISVRAFGACCCLLLVLAVGVGVNWRLAGGTHIRPTRSQLRLLRNDDPRQHSYGVRLPGVHVIPAALIRTQLALSTSRFTDSPPDALLYLSDVPAGNYQLRVKREPSPLGELSVGVGRATGPVWRGSLANGSTDVLRFHLPAVASSLVVKGNADARRFVREVALIPEPHGQVSSDISNLRLRDAVRFGDVVIFTTDDRALLDSHGLWVLAGRQPEVVMHTDSVVSALELELRNVAVPNRVGLRAGRWSAERALSANETWRVRVPVAGMGTSFRVGFRVESGLPLSKGLLGCRIEIR